MNDATRKALLDEYVQLSRAIAHLKRELDQEEKEHEALYLEAQTLYQQLQAAFHDWWPPIHIKRVEVG